MITLLRMSIFEKTKEYKISKFANKKNSTNDNSTDYTSIEDINESKNYLISFDANKLNIEWKSIEGTWVKYYESLDTFLRSH